MTWFLDTNICIYHLKNSAPKMSERLKKTLTSDVKIPSMVAAELLYGAEKSGKRAYNLKVLQAFFALYEIIPFSDQAITHYAAIRTGLERKGQPIGGNDLVIAATVMAHGGVLVTHNTSEFSRVEGLLLDDWVVFDA